MIAIVAPVRRIVRPLPVDCCLDRETPGLVPWSLETRFPGVDAVGGVASVGTPKTGCSMRHP
jgi:hypothetical protein